MRWSARLALLGLAACSSAPLTSDPPAHDAGPAETSTEAAAPVPDAAGDADAGAETPDAGSDAGLEAGTDASPDAPTCPATWTPSHAGFGWAPTLVLGVWDFDVCTYGAANENKAGGGGFVCSFSSPGIGGTGTYSTDPDAGNDQLTCTANHYDAACAAQSSCFDAVTGTSPFPGYELRGTLTITSSSSTGMRGTFDLRNGSMHYAGAFNATAGCASHPGATCAP